MKYNFDKRPERKSVFDSKYGKGIKSNAKYGNELIFSGADMDFECSYAIKKVLSDIVERNVYGYSFVMGDETLFTDAVISWFRRRQGLELKPENIITTEGSLEGRKIAVEAFTKPGDGIIIQKPGYGPFESYVINPTGRKVVINNLLCDENGHYTVDYADLEEKAKDPQNKLFMLCSPHNPVGRVWTKEELLKMYEICQKYGVLIISDEVHSDFIRPGVEFVSLMKLVGGKGVITCTSAGKTFNLAQLKPGVALITDEELIPAYRKTAGLRIVNDFKMYAQIAAYTQSDDWLEQMLEYIEGNIDAAREFLAKHMPKVKCPKPEGTYLLWMDFSGYGLSDEEIHRRIYDEALVTLENGTDFGGEIGKGWQRMIMAAPRPRILEALERIAKEFEE